jgi:hypothetical protein
MVRQRENDVGSLVNFSYILIIAANDITLKHH